jgi:tetratricopeptide (TPR) repeat protein
MARHVLKLGVAFATCWFAVLTLGGCSGGGPMVAVLRGNLAYARGDYQTALVHYLAAEERAEDRGWVLFNTGNVYYALGEQDAALTAWADARTASASVDSGGDEPAGSTLLIHAASYNRGVLFYERGDYRAAYEDFRYALRLNPRSMAAKTNLELALRKIRSAEQAEQMGGEAVSGEGDGRTDEPDASTLRILEYVRRKEAQRWFANRESDDSPDPRDW